MDHSPEENIEANSVDGKIVEVIDGEENLTTILSQMRIEGDSAKALQDDAEVNISFEGSEPNDATQNCEEFKEDEGENFDGADEGLEAAEMGSQIYESIETSSMDANSSEQSWMLKSLSELSVACVTSDFAMQNVIFQIGLRLVAPGGKQIRELQPAQVSETDSEVKTETDKNMATMSHRFPSTQVPKPWPLYSHFPGAQKSNDLSLE